MQVIFPVSILVGKIHNIHNFDRLRKRKMINQQIRALKTKQKKEEEKKLQKARQPKGISWNKQR